MREFLVVPDQVTGFIQVADGTEYDVSPRVIEVDSAAHVQELNSAIGAILNEMGQ